MERSLILKEEVLKFKMTNKTIFDIDEMFDNFGDVINGVMYGKNLYNNSIKVLVASCITRDISIEELLENLTPKQITSEIVGLATNIYFDYMGVNQSSNEKKESKDSKKKLI